MATERSGIFVALGANLPSAVHGAPRATLEAAVRFLAREGVQIVKRSSWWQSAAQPVSDQPDFINGVVEIGSTLPPDGLLALLHRIEASFGRVRQTRWGARVLDLDLIDYRGQSTSGEGGDLILPHPRLQERLFVLLPLQEIAPEWRHPVSGVVIDALIGQANVIKINKLE
jgi:2-amino-4-hydroxy-6-hydroxymethyldihydropteridine diphosphokinase